MESHNLKEHIYFYKWILFKCCGMYTTYHTLQIHTKRSYLDFQRTESDY